MSGNSYFDQIVLSTVHACGVHLQHYSPTVDIIIKLKVEFLTFYTYNLMLYSLAAVG